MHADWLFRMPTEHLASAHHAGGGTARRYELDWSFNAAEGASHSLDVLLVFGALSPTDIAGHPAAHSDAVNEYDQLSRAMRKDWVAFASSGDAAWGPYEPVTRTTRLSDTEITNVPYPTEASRRLWANYRFAALDLIT